MKSMNWIGKTVGATALALGLSAPAMAANYPDFTINQASVPGCSADAACVPITADRLNGLFTETFIPSAPDASGNGTFTTTATFNISAYYNNDVLVPALLGCSPAACYNLYATFTASGTYTGGGTGTQTFTGTSGTFMLFADPDQIFGGADDYLLASSSALVSGTGNFTGPPDTGNANGNFEIIWNPVTLTPSANCTTTPTAGVCFFTAPRPFYLQVDANGNFTENPLTNRTVSGSANAFFATVPEP
ncbi:MAG: flocculation-associated PEP-CTERM protein PepA, partial [Betaproteobacteria bacterium]